MTDKIKLWLGAAPKSCDMCDGEIKDDFVDGRTQLGPWANMCLACFRDHGVGLGVGKGQLYQKTPSGHFQKIGG